MRIGVKLCGSCNPEISTGQVYQEIREAAAESLPWLEFVPWDAGELDLLLVISGCPVDCATRPEGNRREIIVAGQTVNWFPCSAENLRYKVIDFLRTASEEKPDFRREDP